MPRPKKQMPTGRTLYDFLSELFAQYGIWLIVGIVGPALIAIAWVHHQTPPGATVKVLGFDLYQRAPDQKTQEGLGGQEPATFQEWWTRK